MCSETEVTIFHSVFEKLFYITITIFHCYCRCVLMVNSLFFTVFLLHFLYSTVTIFHYLPLVFVELKINHD